MQGSRRDPLALRHSAIVFWAIVTVTLALDQAVKALVRSKMFEGQSIPVIDGVFEIAYVRNTGAAFGLMPGKQTVFIVATVFVLVAIAAYWRRSRPVAWPIVVGLSLVTSGAIGNLIDRVFLDGMVTDFLYVALIDFPVFNIADSCVFIGVVLLIGWLLLVPESQGQTATDATGLGGHGADDDEAARQHVLTADETAGE